MTRLVSINLAVGIERLRFGVVEFLTAIYRKSHGDLFIGGYKKGGAARGTREGNDAWTRGMGKVRFGAQSEEAHKIGQFGTRMKMRSRMSTGCRAIFLFSVFFTTHTCDIWLWNESKRNGGNKETRREREIDKRCKVPFVMMSYSIYRDQFRDLSVVSLRFREKLER